MGCARAARPSTPLRRRPLRMAALHSEDALGHALVNGLGQSISPCADVRGGARVEADAPEPFRRSPFAGARRSRSPARAGARRSRSPFTVTSETAATAGRRLEGTLASVQSARGGPARRRLLRGPLASRCDRRGKGPEQRPGSCWQGQRGRRRRTGAVQGKPCRAGDPVNVSVSRCAGSESESSVAAPVPSPNRESLRRFRVRIVNRCAGSESE